MRARPQAQLGLLDGLAGRVPGNEFLEGLERLVDWGPLRLELETLFSAATGRLPRPPLMVFKMLLLQHCYGLSDPQCEEVVGDRLSWRRFVGPSFEDKVPDETTLVRFRGRLVAAGLHERLLGLVNGQLAAQGLILKRVTLVDATLLQAARRAPRKGEPKGGDPAADHTVKAGQPHYGYKAHVAVDEAHTLIRRAELSAASDHDSRHFEAVVRGDEQMVTADKAYWSQVGSAWLAARGIENGILRRGARNGPLGEPARQLNRCLSGVRSGIEKVFGHWKRSLGYRRVRYLGLIRNRLELKCVVWNLRRWVNLAPAR
jgi:IS5 family transposase